MQIWINRLMSEKSFSNKRNFKQFILIFTDTIAITLAIYLSMMIRFGDFTITFHRGDHYSYLMTLFFSLFIGIVIWAVRADKKYLKKMEELPLDVSNNNGEQNNG